MNAIVRNIAAGVAPIWGAPSPATKASLLGIAEVRTMGLIGDRTRAIYFSRLNEASYAYPGR